MIAYWLLQEMFNLFACSGIENLSFLGALWQRALSAMVAKCIHTNVRVLENVELQV